MPEVLTRFPGARTAKVKVAEPGQALADDVGTWADVLDETTLESALRALPVPIVVIPRFYVPVPAGANHGYV